MFKRFTELDGWKEARTLVNIIYKMTKDGLFSKDFGLKEQIQRASVSVMSNIAEGVAAKSHIEFMRFLNIARRSSNETQSLLFVALDQKYISEKEFESSLEQANKISQIINGLIRYLEKNLRNNETTKQRNNEI